MSWDLLLFSLVIKSLWLFAVRIYISRWWAVAGIQMDLFPKNFLISWSFLWNSSSFTHWILFKIRFYFFKRNLFIWLCWVLVVARGIFSCGLQTLSCLRWDLVPWPGSEPRPPALGAQSLTTGAPGKSPPCCFCLKMYFAYLTYSVGFPGGASGKEPACQRRRHETRVLALGCEDPLEGMTIHSNILAWRIPWTDEPGGLPFIGLQRVRHNLSNLACTPAWLLWEPKEVTTGT